MRARGEGCVYQRSDSRYWWIKYSRNGKPFRQSTEFLVDCGNDKKNATARRNAANLLAQKLAEIKTHTFVNPKTERITVAELAADFLREYRINNRKSIGHAEFRWKLHLEPFFGHLRASEVTSTDIARYIDARQEAGASNGTVNRELAALKRMFRLGLKGTPPKVQRVPEFGTKLKESDPRQGFLTDAQRDALARECGKVGLWMRTMFEICSVYGWRSGEVKGLRVRHVDTIAGTIRLDTSKNGTGRTVTFEPASALGQLLTACVAGKKSDDAVFTREDGVAVRDFRKTWHNVCRAAGVPELIVHDLRRTAARNLRRAGVSENVVMAIGGWKTRSVLDRYSITSENDVTDAMRKLDADRRERSRYGHVQAEAEIKAETNLAPN